MTASIELPRYAAGADFAASLIAGLDTAAVRGQDVRLDATQLTSSSSSFARGCVEGLLVDAGAERLVVVGGPEHFRMYLADAMRSAGLEPARLAMEPSSSELSHA